jgi:polyphosphate kinase
LAEKPFPYLNRELSMLDFHNRVLHQAQDRRAPPLERLRFVGIVAMIDDDFFQIRVAGLRRQLTAGSANAAPDGLTPAEQLAEIRRRIEVLVAALHATYVEVRAELAEHGIRLLDYAQASTHHQRLRERFVEEIFPVLTPLAVDPGHPFPYISTLSLSIAVVLHEPAVDGMPRFARVKVPPTLQRLVEVEPGAFVFVEDVIRANLDLLFPGLEVAQTYAFRVTRNADLDIAEDEADDLLLAVEEELRRRRFGEAVRLEVERATPPEVRAILRRGIGVPEEDCYGVDGPLDLTGLLELVDLPRPELKGPAWSPVVPARLAGIEDGDGDIFDVIRSGDVLVHHPYESFAASVEQFIGQAAEDPAVLAIKQTLYRTGSDSPIVRALTRAVDLGKQVAVLVEIKARADEEANIAWARTLERAGAHVAYGLVGLKTHCKIALVVRREEGGLRRYVHIGTGNYNPKTARAYTDVGLLSCRPELGADVTELFNLLTGLSRQRRYRRLLVSPHGLRERLFELIEREIAHAAAGCAARVTLKTNNLVDPECIEALYRASRAGVDVDLIVRSRCSLVPGVEGVSERIRVRSIVGEFLEHSRIVGFANGGEPEWYIGSADIMERNLDRRIEAFAPIEDAEARARIEEIVRTLLADDRRSWQLGPDGVWRRTEELNGADGSVDAFEELKRRALEAASRPADRGGESVDRLAATFTRR